MENCRLEDLYRPTWAEVSLSAIKFNLNQVKKLIGNQVRILAVLKADAYGHGAVRVAEELKKYGVEYFGVATVLEAIELRKNKIDLPILLLSTSSFHECPVLIRYKIIPTIADLKTAAGFNKELNKLKVKMPIHIKIDTGMGRIGVWHRDSLNFVKSLSKLNNLILEGIYTHFSSADEDERFTDLQLTAFKKLINDLQRNGIYIPLKHTANSIAVIRHRQSYFNLVRPGLMIYGLYSLLASKRFIELKPVMSFKTRIVYLKKVPTGRSISYGRTFITKRRSKIATLPVGYADGYNRLLSNKADVLVRGKRCPVIGRICMDQAMVDVTSVNARVGDEVVLIGRQRQSKINAEEIAHLCSTISYEVVCWISKRVPRIYVK